MYYVANGGGHLHNFIPNNYNMIIILPMNGGREVKEYNIWLNDSLGVKWLSLKVGRTCKVRMKVRCDGDIAKNKPTKLRRCIAG